MARVLVVVFLILTPNIIPTCAEIESKAQEKIQPFVTKLLRPVQLLLEEQAAALGTPLAPLKSTRSPRH